jgi:sugar/nucleoside kinase (ribokinase family)
MPEGAYLRTRGGERFSCGSLKLPDGFIVGTVGAGDAFCAGMLYGLHEGWAHPDCMRLGSACAAACLSEANASDGLRPLAAVRKLAKRFAERPAPI